MRSLITTWLRRLRPSSWRHVAGAALFIVALAAVLGGLAQARIETSVSSFLPADDPEVEELTQVSESFGGDPVAVLIEKKRDPGMLVQPRLSRVLRLEGELAQLPGVASVYGPATTLNRIAGRAQEFIAELAGRRDGIRARAVSEARKAGADRAAAAAAGARAVAKFDARYGPLLLQGMPTGMPTLDNPRFVQSVIFGKGSTPRPQWRFVVPSADAIVILVRPQQGADAEATAQLVDNIRNAVDGAALDAERVTVSGAPAVAAALSEQVTDEIPLMGGLAVVGVGACLLLVPWTAWRRRLVPLGVTLFAVASTVSLFGWLNHPLSLGVVAFLSVLLGVGSYYTTYFTHRVEPRTVFVVASATAASFATLLLSPIPFVRDLGFTLGVGVLVSTTIGWAVMHSPVMRDPGGGAASAPARPPPEWRVKRPAVWSLGAVSVAVACAGWALLPVVDVETDVNRLASGIPELDEAQHAGKVIGSSGEIRIALSGPDTLSPEAFAWMRQAQNRLIAEHGDDLQPALSLPSLLSFLGPAPTASQLDAGAKLLPPYLVDGVVRPDRSMAALSFSIDTSDIAEIKRIRQDIDATLPAPPSAFEADVTGIPIAGARANDLVSQERVFVNAIGILAAGLVLAIGLTRRVDALRAVGAAVIATGAGFLLLWLADLPLTPLTVALGSLTAAVACEFTVLLAAAAREGNHLLRRAVVLAATASAVGYLVLVFSQIALIREFGILLGSTVVLAFGASTVVVALTVRKTTTQPMSRAAGAKELLVGAE